MVVHDSKFPVPTGNNSRGFKLDLQVLIGIVFLLEASDTATWKSESGESLTSSSKSLTAPLVKPGVEQ